jgi:hypothetical protein
MTTREEYEKSLRFKAWYYLKKNDPEWLERHREKSRNYSRKKIKSMKRGTGEWIDYHLKKIEEHKRKKQKVMDAYGGCCQCCGEKHLGFLTIDHIGGGGKQHLKQIGGQNRLYPWLIKNNFPKDKFRVLCMNCNFAIRFNPICPHKLDVDNKK